ncbi:protein deadpan [Drosophila guanche]|uniref:Blast:Protein deadpan n=2 Tax=Drosophila guanche TaxID=7266 RepID=A0A3B0J3B6_DROGU|nr:protein deadpan [Drosophila guanche]SPP73722.1 blast:Protein deadpan [Drosophila guanche]
MDYKNDLNSDDDFDCSNGYSDSYGSNGRMSNPNGLSKAELRKTNKPIMEKRRRARINHCLNELKSLILEAMKKDPARHTKLEKADILEMTVKHLQSVQRQQLNMAIQTDPGVVQKFKTGFVECAEEVNRYVSQLDVDTGVRQRLSAHLNNCANSLEQIGSMSNFNNGYRGQIPAGLFPAAVGGIAASTPLFPSLPQDLNNNSRTETTPPSIQMGGLQLIPSRLPSGEFALIMPNTAGATVPPAGPFVWPGATVAAGGPASAALASIANPTHLSDYAQSFRLSAFSKPPSAAAPTGQIASNTQIPAQTQLPVKNRSNTPTSSPPLSPISSMSSHCDESRAASPTVDVLAKHSFAGVFSTPPPTSAETSFNTSGSLNLSAGSHDSSGCSRSLVHLQQQQVSSTSGHAKREREAEVEPEPEPEADSSDCSLDEPSSKKFLVAAIDKSSSAWRPW